MKLVCASFGRLGLLVAAGMWAGFCTARVHAQLYSVNAVGYVDLDLVTGFNLVANPLNAGNHAIPNLFPAMPEGSLFVPWDKSLQDFGPTNRFVEGVGWVPGTAQLPGGEGAYVWVPRATRVTFVGEPWTYTLASCTTFPEGSTLSSIWPLLLCGYCGGFIDPCPPDLPDMLEVYRWDPASQSFLDPTIYFEGFGWLPEEPRLAPGEAALFMSPGTFTARSPAAVGMVPRVRLTHPQHDGTNFSLRCWADGPVAHSLRRATHLSSNRWQTIQTQTGPPGGGWLTFTDPAPASAACFYRLDCLRLLRPARQGTTFSFQFHAEAGVAYRVSRKVSLADPTWLAVLTIPASPAGGLVTATDATATGSAGYYRLEY